MPNQFDNIIDFKQFLYKLYYNWYYILLSLVIALIIAFAYIRYTTEYFVSEASVIIEEQSNSNLKSSFLPENVLTSSKNLENKKFLLTSFPLVSKTIQPGNNILNISDLNHGIYSLSIKAKISNRWFDHTSSKFIQKIKGLEPEIVIDRFELDQTDNIEIDVTSKGLDNLTLQSSEDGGISWKALNSRNVQNDEKKRHQFRFPTDKLKFNL